MNIFTKISYLNILFKNKNKEKRKFLIAGVFNVLVTNFFLQIFLLTNFFNVTISTLISQLINMALGYSIYGKLIFKVKNIKSFNFVRKYIYLMIIVWLINTIGIYFGGFFNISNNYSALIMMPVLALMSYLAQKFWVFK